jgi:4-carboxymuconolactone decarboxylase
MSRITPLPEPLPEAVAQRMARLVPPNMTPPVLFRAVARNAALFNHLVDSGLIGPTGLLDRKAVPKSLREAVILRTCVATRNVYEWRLHVGTISARMGLSAAQIADTRSATPDARLWSEAERSALALADALVARLAVDEALYARVRSHFDEPRLIELTQLIGLYTGVAMLVALIQPQADDYAAPWPHEQEQCEASR